MIRIAAPILYFSTRGTAVQILKAIRFFLFRDNSFTRGQPPISVIGHWRILSYGEFYFCLDIKPPLWIKKKSNQLYPVTTRGCKFSSLQMLAVFEFGKFIPFSGVPGCKSNEWMVTNETARVEFNFSSKNILPCCLNSPGLRQHKFVVYWCSF